MKHCTTGRVYGQRTRTELLPVIKLAESAQTRTPAEFLARRDPPADRAQKWSADLVPFDLVKHIRQSLAQRQPLALHVPMSVESRTSGPQPTFFNVFVEHSYEDSEKPVFIRDELIICDVKSPRISQVRSLIIVEDGPLAGLLRDAETPAHTQWNTGTSKFKGKYKFGPGAINFVRLSVSELLESSIRPSKSPIRPSLSTSSLIPAARRRRRCACPAAKTPYKTRHRPDATAAASPAQATPLPHRQAAWGVAIRVGDPDAALPPFIDVRVAYDVHRGNPLRKYHQADFDLGRSPIKYDMQMSGVNVKSASGNQMLVAVNRAEFNLEVTGFDPDRDLVRQGRS